MRDDSPQASDFMLSASPDTAQDIMGALDAFESGDYEGLPISRSYIVHGGWSILATNGHYIILTIDDDDEYGPAYDVHLIGSIRPV